MFEILISFSIESIMFDRLSSFFSATLNFSIFKSLTGINVSTTAWSQKIETSRSRRVQQWKDTKRSFIHYCYQTFSLKKGSFVIFRSSHGLFHAFCRLDVGRWILNQVFMVHICKQKSSFRYAYHTELDGIQKTDRRWDKSVL